MPWSRSSARSVSLPDEVTTSLLGLGSLIVRSNTTVARISRDGWDLETVASKADVDAILTGTLLRAGDELRVNTQLIQVPSGTVVWSKQSQVPLGDVFRLLDELTRTIVESLSIPFSGRDRRILKLDTPASVESYEYYLRANQLARHSKQWSIARDMYLKCLEDDPNYAPAWARVGRLHRVLAIYTGERAEEGFELSQVAFRRALELNPDLSVATTCIRTPR